MRETLEMIRIDKSNVASLLHSIDTIIFDCDGVLWRGKSLIPDAASTISSLRQQGKRLFFLTNNSTKSRLTMLAKFERLGMPVSVEEILGSSFLVAAYLKEYLGELSADEWIYVVGRKGIVEELSLVGFRAFGLVLAL